MDAGELGLQRGGDEGDRIRGARALAARLHGKEHQAHCAHGYEERERANLHFSDPRKRRAG